MKQQSFEDYMLTIPGYARPGFNRSLAKQIWNHQQETIDELTQKLEANKLMHHSLNSFYTELKDKFAGLEKHLSSAVSLLKYYEKNPFDSRDRISELLETIKDNQ